MFGGSSMGWRFGKETKCEFWRTGPEHLVPPDTVLNKEYRLKSRYKVYDLRRPSN